MSKEGNLGEIENKLRDRLSQVSKKMAGKTAHQQPYGLEKISDDERLYHYLNLTTQDKKDLFMEKGMEYLKFADRMEELRTKRGV